MADEVILDALIPREDLEESESERNKQNIITAISHTNLINNDFFLLNLYKPDFQRETSQWKYDKVAGFINSFLNKELIPSVILWQSNSGKVFVIDGAHRLSCLIAWINDDYGDGIISRKYYNGNLPEEQIAIAEKTRNYIKKNVGEFSKFKDALSNPKSYSSEEVKLARFLSNSAIQTQWVEGDINSAQQSFFNINQQATPISKTEIEILESRKKPQSIAARAIMRAGQDNNYWSKFDEENQEQIVKIAKEIYNIMFSPKLNTPIKTLDVPMCGKHSNSALQVIYYLICICNGNKVEEDDITGEKTIDYLKRTRKILRLINSKHESSLGLHPLVYFYSANGSFKVSALYTFVLFVIELDNRNKKNLFIKHRKGFETIYYEYSSIVQKISRDARLAIKGAQANKDLFMDVLMKLENGITKDKVINEISKDEKYKKLNISDYKKDGFSKLNKNEIFIRDALKNCPRCKICGGYLHVNSMSIDHIIRKEDGGTSDVSNGQVTHPYCNTGYKN